MARRKVVNRVEIGRVPSYLGRGRIRILVTKGGRASHKRRFARGW